MSPPPYTDEQVKALVKVCEDWRKEYDPGCPEALYQVDAVNESLADLAEAIGRALGWWKGHELSTEVSS